MKDSVKLGTNKTGMQMSPLLSKELVEGLIEFKEPSSRSTITPSDLKKQYITESGQIGSVPPPGSVKGTMNTGVQMLKGNDPVILIDKLGERAAYERSGVRLYDAMIAKCEALEPAMDLSILREIRNDEHNHFLLVMHAIEELGADPTVQTPCADVSAVASMGLMQVLNDPRTTIAQCAEALLIAELTDNDAWDLLIQLTRDAGLDEITKRFEGAKVQEEKHLLHIRNWLQELVMKNKSVPLQ